ncbi:Carboxylesterase NlhH [Nocardioides dokdonensis FR1436]|uniref:Carboxylesterase NlhH n=1 Tax=Nocardioides dokdonensis FR1436 TaxID=1300347 RepID=A0A1A9GIS6_9ACTN|nr:alpha/beta hydrolase [Nocardioides dokdonensis]ANH38144.1 Carboxylesterase NlhH [Nocardioides dokdonensis FR1436]
MTFSRVRHVVERSALRGLTGLPGVVQRRVGRPVVRDTQTLADDVRLMLALQRLAREPAVETLPVAQGRRELNRQTALVAGDDQVAEEHDLRVGDLAARLYVPQACQGPGAHPLLLFFHGGGFVYGDLASHDAPCRLLAQEAGVRVLSVDYRLAPEHRFPAAHDDALAAYRWLLEHADEVGADTARLAVGGDSAGGNLAAATALAAAEEGLPLALQLLVYPGTDALRDTESLRLFGDGFYLTQGFIDLAADAYYPQLSEEERRDPRISPVYADLAPAVAARLAPVFLCTAGFDPLRDEGEAYARRLEEAGVAVELRRFEDQIHGFLNMTGAVRSSRAAVVEVAHRLSAGLA